MGVTIRSSTLWLVFCFTLALGQAQKREVQLINNEIFVREPSGALRQLTHDGSPKEHVIVSPAGQKVVYNRPWTAYGMEAKPPVFVVLDLESGRELREIQPTVWLSRFISEVVWIDERFLMVVGEFVAVFDVEGGKQTHFLHGGRFTLSPDRKKIVFLKGRLPLYGYIPPEYESDEIMLAVVESGVSAKGINSTARAVYPELRPWGDLEDRRYEELNERHQMRSGLFWPEQTCRPGRPGPIAVGPAHPAGPDTSARGVPRRLPAATAGAAASRSEVCPIPSSLRRSIKFSASPPPSLFEGLKMTARQNTDDAR